MSVTCSNGHENLDGMTFCEDCGVELTSITNTPPPPVADTQAYIPALVAVPPAPVVPDPAAIAPPTPEPAPPVPGIAPVQTLVSEPIPNADPTTVPAPTTAGSTAAAGAYLEITQGPFVGRRFSVTEPVCVIGRWDIDSAAFPQIDLTDVDTDAKVSRKHARITKDGDRYLLEDLGSLNGTSHQGSSRLVPGDQRQLNNGDTVIMGRLFMRFGTN